MTGDGVLTVVLRRSDGKDLYPIRDAGASLLDFADWYLGWLTAAEAACGLDR
jgi:hypothetical protein